MTATPRAHSETADSRRRLLVIGVITATTVLRPAWAEGQAHRIEIKAVAYVPVQVTVRVGDRVVWDNRDIVAHTATSGPGGFDVDLRVGGSGDFVATRLGSFDYTCRYHPTMKGRITVAP